MTTIDWIWIGGGSALGLAGLAVLTWALFGDRARGRRRCPRCWYAIHGVEALRCPECGRTFRRPRSLTRTRRQWRLALVGLAAALAGATTIGWQRVHLEGWLGAVPTLAYVAFLPRLDDAQWTELSDRIDSGTVRGWEYELLVRRAVGVLENHEHVDPPRLRQVARLLGRAESTRAVVSDIDRDGAVAALVGLIGHPDRGVEVDAVGALCALGPHARVALPVLMGQLADRTRPTFDAVMALDAMTPGEGHHVLWYHQSDGWLWSGLSASDRAYFGAVGACGTDVDRALPVLVDGLARESRHVRVMALQAAALLGHDEPGVRESVLDLFADDSPRVREQVLRAATLFPLDARVAGVTRAGFRDAEDRVRLAAIQAAGLRGPAGREPFEAQLLRALRTADLPDGIGPTTASLLRIGADVETVVAVALERVGGPGSERRHAMRDALVSLYEHGRRCEAAADRLLHLLDSPYPDLRGAAAAAIATLGGDLDVTTPIVLDGSMLGRHAGIDRLERLARAGLLSVHSLRERLESPDASRREVAARCLGLAGRRAVPALDRLRELSLDMDRTVADVARDAIRRIEADG